jgi:putative transposase
MARKKHTVEQIIGKLREAEVALSKGQTVLQVCRTLGVTEQTYYRWRQAYNQVRPHSALGYRPPAPESVEPQCA